MIFKEIIANQLYVYMNGKLLYKRWMDKDKNYGMVFCPVQGNFKSSNNADMFRWQKSLE